MKRWIIIFLCSFFISSFADDILSQWRGPNRDGYYPEKNLLKKWPAAGPVLLWSVDDLGEGYSSAAVTSDKVFITGMTDGNGFLSAFDRNGKRLWRITYGPEWDGGHQGARTTPTVVGDKLYLMSGLGNVVCLNSQNGKLIWQVDMIKSFGARNLRWGMTESLLVDGDRVFCTPGGRETMMVILNRHSGKTIKTIPGNGEESSYSSPLLIKHQGKPYVLAMTGRSVVGLDAEKGDYLWRYDHITQYDINPNTPLYHDGHIFTVSGYGSGGQLLKISADGKKASRIWANEIMDSQMGSAILFDGHLYGSGHKNKGWHCLVWETGELKYSSKDLGKKGNIISADGLLYCYDESGTIGLVRPDPKKFDLISSFEIEKGSGPHWAHPVIKDGRLYVRHGEALMAFDISATP